MGILRSLVTPLHRRTARDYLGRMADAKVDCMTRAKEYGADYWDGDRRFGYGGYRYDGRWRQVAEKIALTYEFPPAARILDVGCGKAHLLYELTQVLPGATVAGFDVSDHALRTAKAEVAPFLYMHAAQDPYPYPDDYFDLVISINTLHNLEAFDLKKALGEIERVGKRGYICIESYRNEQELFNLQCWALTCEAFFSRSAWEWLFGAFGYTGDYEFIYFE